MSGPRRLLHPGLLRKLAMFSILAGLVVLFAFYKFQGFPMLIGADHWLFEPDTQPTFIIAVDGLFLVGLLAHLTAIGVVLVERNAGIFGRRRGRSRPTAPTAAAYQPEMPQYDPGTASYNQEPASYNQEPVAATPPASDAEPLGVRLRAVWGEVRETMRSRRGPEPEAPVTPPAPRQLGTTSVNDSEDTDVEH